MLYLFSLLYFHVSITIFFSSDKQSSFMVFHTNTHIHEHTISKIARKSPKLGIASLVWVCMNVFHLLKSIVCVYGTVVSLLCLRIPECTLARTHTCTVSIFRSIAFGKQETRFIFWCLFLFWDLHHITSCAPDCVCTYIHVCLYNYTFLVDWPIGPTKCLICRL